MKKLIIASHNQDKVAEILDFVKPYGFAVETARQHGVSEPEETGNSFADNALLKVRNTFMHTHLPSLADDSGMAVDALGGAPGIYSARWGGESRDFNMAMQRVKTELEAKNISPNGSVAFFICVLAYIDETGAEHIFEGSIKGHLSFPPRGSHGFGYDPIFVPDGYDKSFAELGADIKKSISHRSIAMAKFRNFLAQ